MILEPDPSFEAWEHGVIKLPTAELPRLRQALADAQTAHQEGLFARAQEFWLSLSRKQRGSLSLYLAAYASFRSDQEAAGAPVPFELDDLVGAGVQPTRIPRRVRRDDLDLPTNRTTRFDDEDVHIVFDRDKATVTWDVDPSGDAVARARDSHLAKAFFPLLATVKWTRQTGGALYGNDSELVAAAADGYGTGNDFPTAGFGPLGAKMAPAETSPYTLADGTTVECDDFRANVVEAERQARFQRRHAERQHRRAAQHSSGGAQGRVPAGAGITGGQFADKAQSLPEVSFLALAS